jgi:hypothetical protein
MNFALIIAVLGPLASASLVCLDGLGECSKQMMSVTSRHGPSELLLKASHRGIDADVHLASATFALFRDDYLHYSESGSDDLIVRGLISNDIVLLVARRGMNRRALQGVLRNPEDYPCVIARIK